MNKKATLDLELEDDDRIYLKKVQKATKTEYWKLDVTDEVMHLALNKLFIDEGLGRFRGEQRSIMITQLKDPSSQKIKILAKV